jgi:hypothetical protein
MTIKLYTQVKELLGDYVTRSIQIVPGLFFQQHKKLQMCEFYANSKYLGGVSASDVVGGIASVQRDRPFYNICNFRVTLAKTATDLDVKDIQIESDDPQHYTRSMLLQHKAYEWMKEVNFSYTLNDVGLKRAKYGGVIVKKTTQKGKDGKDELHVDTLDWRNLVTDQVDIMSGTLVETHYFTPVELLAKEDVWKLSDMKDIIRKSKKNKGNAQKYDNKQETHNSDRIVIREVTGTVSQDYYKDFMGEQFTDDDVYTYQLSKFYYADVQCKCYPLYCEELEGEMKDHYRYLPWEEMPGRALGRGIIEDAEEAQVWTNDSIINEKQVMDLAGKVTISTNSKQVGNNILEVDHGHIFELEEGKEMHALQLAPTSMPEYDAQVRRWRDQVDQATSSFDANTGKQPPADTPYSQTALLNQVASKPFDYRREEAGIFWTEIFNDWIIPYLVKRLKKGGLFADDFTQEELDVIDDEFATFEANKRLKPAIMEGKIVSMEDYLQGIDGFKKLLKGSKRFLQIPDGYFDNIEAKITVLTTGEQKNKGAILQSLSTILGDVMKSFNPQTGKFGVLEDPTMSRIFGTILELSGAGISPISLGIGKPQSPAPAGQAPMQQPQGMQPLQAQPQTA